jgi:carbon starvation protein
MTLPLIAGTVLAALALGYTLYGKLIARQYRLDDAKTLPSEEINDGVDFVPTKPFYLLGQHFSAIAAAGPIVGPIAACLAFGWLPCLLWIGLGVIFIGAVHDFSALVASVRHRAKSVAEIVKHQMGRRAGLAIMSFIWIALVYVIVAFTDATAGTFLGRIEELDGVKVDFNSGGAVAAASAMYLLLAVAMGLVQKRWNPPLWIVTAIFVPATLGVVWLGTKLSTVLVLGWTGWVWSILIYCLIASMLPVWLLLQPRGYLGGFVLYLALAVGVIGIFSGRFEIQQPAFKAASGPKMESLMFPFLFVTIACGACSGFHGLVCSGTTSKQIAKESHCHPVGYGAMLLEGFVALIALSTVMVAVDPKGAPGAIYGRGIGEYLVVLIGPENRLFAVVFGSMVFSTFVFDTLDVATRLSRYLLQEIFGLSSTGGAVLATAAGCAVPLGLLLAAGEGSWRAYWTLFGTSNQLLAALTLLAVTLWLRKEGRPCWFTFLPMLFVMGMTAWSLVIQLLSGFKTGATTAQRINGGASLVLLALAGFLAIEAAGALRRPREAAAAS